MSPGRGEIAQCPVRCVRKVEDRQGNAASPKSDVPTHPCLPGRFELGSGNRRGTESRVRGLDIWARQETRGRDPVQRGLQKVLSVSQQFQLTWVGWVLANANAATTLGCTGEVDYHGAFDVIGCQGQSRSPSDPASGGLECMLYLWSRRGEPKHATWENRGLLSLGLQTPEVRTHR